MLALLAIAGITACKRSEGGQCESDKNCKEALICFAGTCQTQSDADAKCDQVGSNCAEKGLCTARSGRCVATDAACAKLDICRTQGQCKAQDDKCVATDDLCPRLDACAGYGGCKVEDGRCVAVNSAAPPASSAPADPPPPPPAKPWFTDRTESKLQKLLASAVPVAEFEKTAEQNAWAIYQAGTTDCPVMGQATRLDKPEDAVREFDREKYRSELVGKLVVSWLDGEKLQPQDTAGGFGDRNTLSRYNQAAGSFTITVRAEADGKWSVLGGSPTIKTDKELSELRDVWVADRGDGYVLTAPRMVPFYINGSVATFTVKVDAEAARSWTENGITLRYVIVQKVKSAGFHKNCMKVCKRVSMNSVDCPDDPENQGLGMYFVTEPVGYEIYADGKLVAEKQPAGS